MEKRKHKPAGCFLVVVILVFGLLGDVLCLVGGTILGWILLLACVLGLVIIRLALSPRGLKMLLAWVLALTVAASVIFFFRQETQVSFQGVLAREAIRQVRSISFFQGNGLFDLGAKAARVGSLWSTPQGYTMDRYDVNGLHIELLRSDGGTQNRVILLFHGGGYIIPLMDAYRDMAVRYSKLSGGASVLLVDYRVAPESQFPAALDDAQEAWDWLIGEGYLPENMLVAGDSAGGNLAVALTAVLRDLGRPMPRALVLMSPWLDLTEQGESYTANATKDPMFGIHSKKAGEAVVLGSAYSGRTSLTNAYLSPAYGSFTGFPPMLIQVGTWETLESDSLTAAEKAEAAGISVKLTRYEGMFHGFQMLFDLLPESRSAWAEVEAFINTWWGV